MKTKKKALGRGLDAILQSPETDITSKDISGNYVVGAIANIAVEKIVSNPFQPRDQFDDELLKELAASIEKQGIIQPITVRKLGYDKYQLISGERRLRASKVAGISEVPCYIRVANDEQMLEMALVENIHRKDLNAIEIAISYQRLIEECELTHEKLSERISKNRSSITNYLRLLKLPAEIQLALRDDKISMGHARALINVTDPEIQLGILKKIIARDLSVRQVEELVRNFQVLPPVTKKDPVELPEFFNSTAVELRDKLGTNVNIRRNNNGKGQIVISFESDQDFSRILALLD
ncbi:MAG: ParB/RepB/Spo0J family partition protein [Bacteroidales bacterium]|nr:ParB/RepB/Spo0J family partition protein [Bacteroidales bacterium]